MNSASTPKLMLAISAATLLSIASLTVDVANAGERPRAGQSVHRTTTHTGPQGNTSTRVHDRTVTDNGFKSSTAVTGPNGKTASREQTGAYDASTGTWTRNATSTGPNGKTASTNAVVQKTEDGYTRDVTRTGPDGKTATSSAEVVKTENGYTRDVTRTGPNGNTTTIAASGNYDASTGTYTQERTKTLPNGETSSTTRTVTKTPAQP